MCATDGDFLGLSELETNIPGVRIFYSDIYAKESAENVCGILYFLLGHDNYWYPKRPEFSVLVLTQNDWGKYVRNDHLYGEIFYENSCLYCANVMFSIIIPYERITPYMQKKCHQCVPRWWSGVPDFRPIPSLRSDVNAKKDPFQRERWNDPQWQSLGYYYTWSLISEINKLLIDANFHFEKRWIHDLVIDIETYIHLAADFKEIAEVYELWANQLIKHGENHARYRTLAAFEDLGHKLNSCNMAWYQGRIRKAALHLHKKYGVNFVLEVMKKCNLPLQKLVSLLNEKFSGFGQWFSSWEPLAFLKDDERLDDKPLLPLSVWEALKAGYGSEDYGRLELWIRKRGTAPPEEYALHRCPLCGYEDFTNSPVHFCPLAPLHHEEINNLSTPCGSIEANVMSVPMYLVENEKGELICKEKDIILIFNLNPGYTVFKWNEIKSSVLGENITEEEWDKLCLSTLHLMNEICEKFPISIVTLTPNWQGIFTRPKRY